MIKYIKQKIKKNRDEKFCKKWGCLPPNGFRTHGLARWWCDKGCPQKIGTLVEDEMKSGRIAIFKLVNTEWAVGTDWYWYDFEFVNYKENNPLTSPKPVV